MENRKIYFYQVANEFKYIKIFFLVILFGSIILVYNHWSKDGFAVDIYTVQVIAAMFGIVVFVVSYFYGFRELVSMRIEMNDCQIKFKTYAYEVLANWVDIYKIKIEKYPSNYKNYYVFSKIKETRKAFSSELKTAYFIEIFTHNGNFQFINNPNGKRHNLNDIIDQLKSNAVNAEIEYSESKKSKSVTQVIRRNKK